MLWVHSHSITACWWIQWCEGLEHSCWVQDYSENLRDCSVVQITLAALEKDAVSVPRNHMVIVISCNSGFSKSHALFHSPQVLYTHITLTPKEGKHQHSRIFYSFLWLLLAPPQWCFLRFGRDDTDTLFTAKHLKAKNSHDFNKLCASTVTIIHYWKKFLWPLPIRALICECGHHYQ